MARASSAVISGYSYHQPLPPVFDQQDLQKVSNTNEKDRKRKGFYANQFTSAHAINNAIASPLSLHSYRDSVQLKDDVLIGRQIISPQPIRQPRKQT